MNKIKSRPKKQHYVPRFYLANFVNSRGMVWNYDLQLNEVRELAPENTAVETNFYSPENEDGEYFDELEEFLQLVETTAAELYPIVLEGERLNREEKEEFAIFVASLYLRSPAMVTAFAEVTGYLAQQVADATLTNRRLFESTMNDYEREHGITSTTEQRDELFKFANDKEYTFSVDKKRGLLAIMNIESISRIMFKMTWGTFDSGNQHLITSDSPVVRHCPSDKIHPINGDGGLLNRSAQVTLPLSPSRLLYLYWDSNEFLREVYKIRPQIARGFNRIRAYYSERYLYASKKDAGIQTLGQKFKKPGLRFSVSDSEKMATVEVKRKLSKKNWGENK